MSFLGFYAVPYRSGNPLLSEQKQELEYRIHILEEIVPKNPLTLSIKHMSEETLQYNDLSRVIYYNYLVAGADNLHTGVKK
jgi:hypothetical protein